MIDKALFTLKSENFYGSTYLQSADAVSCIMNAMLLGTAVEMSAEQRINFDCVRELGLVMLDPTGDGTYCANELLCEEWEEEMRDDEPECIWRGQEGDTPADCF